MYVLGASSGACVSSFCCFVRERVRDLGLHCLDQYLYLINLIEVGCYHTSHTRHTVTHTHQHTYSSEALTARARARALTRAPFASHAHAVGDEVDEVSGSRHPSADLVEGARDVGVVAIPLNWGPIGINGNVRSGCSG